MKKIISIVAGVAVIIAGAAGYWFFFLSQTPAAVQPPAPVAQSGTVLHVGTIIDENGVVADAEEFKQFDQYLAGALQPQGITGVEFVPVTTVAEMAKLLRQGKVDIYIDSAFPVYVIDKLAETQVIADRWKGGVEKYSTIIFTRADSPVKTIADLRGKIVGFDSLSSTVGYFLPKAFLINKGYTLTEKATTTDAVAPGEIGYVFVHGNVFADVAAGITAAGGESDLETRSYFGPTFDTQYRVLLTTPEVLRFLVTARKQLDSGILNMLKSTLFTMDTTAEGRAVLKSFADTAKFTPAGADTAYNNIVQLTSLVEAEIVRGGETQ